jgi:serine/threonine-protein kinase
MAPEQARGAIDTLDERADVFGLGSILCEILTGAPAYSGKSSDELYRKAEKADLTDALARLDSCGAESELIDVAKSCLAPAAKDRPQNAAGVLARITGYLEGVQLRLQAAGLARAQAEARAVEERKRRILTVALAASIIVIGLLGGGGWAWVVREQARAARAQANEQAMALREFSDALEQAARDLGLARLAPGDQAKWAVALQSAKRAEDSLPPQNPDADQRRRVETLLAQLKGEQTAAAAIGKDQRMVERLNKIHDDLGVHLEAARANDEWSEAFREYGVDIDKLEPAEAGALLHASQVAVELAGMLDQWTFVRRFQLKDDPGADRLLAIAKAADPDPWRNRLRDTLNTAVTDRDKARQTLEQLADVADAESLPAASVTRLAFALSHLGNRPLAISLLKRTQRVHPNGFWVNCDLGRELKEAGQYEEAIRFFSVAVAVRPRSEIALADLGKALQKGGRLEEAAATIRRAIQVRDDDPWPHIALGAVLLDLGQKSDASAEFQAAKSLKSKDWFIPIMIADTLSSHGDWDGAIAEFHEAIRDDPQNAFAHDKLGMTLLDMGRIDESIVEFQEAIRLMHHRPFPPVHGNLGRALLAKGDFPGAIKELRKAVEPGGHSPPFRGRGFERTLEQTQRMAALADRLPALLRGDDHPKDPTDCIEFAKLCRLKRYYADSVRLSSEAFAKRPELASDIRAGNRFSAACSAASASTSEGKDKPGPTGADCRHWRQQALGWLSADLAAYAELIKDERPANREWVRKRLAEWQVVPSLAGIRDEPAVSSLPETERQAFREFWSRVERVRQEATSRASPSGPPA